MFSEYILHHMKSKSLAIAFARILFSNWENDSHSAMNHRYVPQASPGPVFRLVMAEYFNQIADLIYDERGIIPSVTSSRRDGITSLRSMRALRYVVRLSFLLHFNCKKQVSQIK